MKLNAFAHHVTHRHTIAVRNALLKRIIEPMTERVTDGPDLERRWHATLDGWKKQRVKDSG